MKIDRFVCDMQLEGFGFAVTAAIDLVAAPMFCWLWW